MRHYARRLRATLTTLVMLVATAGAAGVEGATRPLGDFYPGCPLDECSRPPSSRGLGSPVDVPESGDKAETLRTFEHAADQGDLAAEWKLGRMYADGDGVPKDDQRAFIYFSQIANTHRHEPPRTAQARIVADAFVALGHYYLKGIPNTTVVSDAVRARDMFAYAASYFGDADAQYQLGRLYLDGSTDPRDAAAWFRLAAWNGDCRAEAVLGDMLFRGQHEPRQAARGLMWLTLGRDCAGTDDNWIKPLYENAFHQANDDERAMALVFLEDWLKGRRDAAVPIQNPSRHTIAANPIQNPAGRQTTSQDISFSVPWFVSPLVFWLPFVALIGVCIFLWRQIATPRALRASMSMTGELMRPLRRAMSQINWRFIFNRFTSVRALPRWAPPTAPMLLHPRPTTSMATPASESAVRAEPARDEFLSPAELSAEIEKFSELDWLRIKRAAHRFTADAVATGRSSRTRHWSVPWTVGGNAARASES
jgi:uncharacterized protein